MLEGIGVRKDMTIERDCHDCGGKIPPHTPFVTIHDIDIYGNPKEESYNLCTKCYKS